MSLIKKNTKNNKEPIDVVLVHKNVKLYIYNMKTGIFTEYPSVLIYQRCNPWSNFKYDEYFAVGVQYTLGAENRRVVSTEENDIYYLNSKQELLIWTDSLDEENIKRILIKFVDDMCNDVIVKCSMSLEKIQNRYDLIRQNLIDVEIIHDVTHKDVLESMSGYIFGIALEKKHD